MLRIQPKLKKNSKVRNSLKGVPGNWSELINSQYKKCPACKGKTTNRWHLFYAHGIKLEPVTRIWREKILPITDTDNRSIAKTLKLSEREFNRYILEDIISHHLELYNEGISKLNDSLMKEMTGAD